MKKTLFILSLFGSAIIFGQEKRVGINTETPRATLEVKEKIGLPETTPQGVLFPSFTSEQRAKFISVKEGTMIYNLTLKCLEIYINKVWKCLGNN